MLRDWIDFVFVLFIFKFPLFPHTAFTAQHYDTYKQLYKATNKYRNEYFKSPKSL
jgi:hypothetical protein